MTNLTMTNLTMTNLTMTNLTMSNLTMNNQRVKNDLHWVTLFPPCHASATTSRHHGVDGQAWEGKAQQSQTM
eukprot:253613-Hanusia_phi.AAC.1